MKDVRLVSKFNTYTSNISTLSKVVFSNGNLCLVENEIKWLRESKSERERERKRKNNNFLGI